MMFSTCWLWAAIPDAAQLPNSLTTDTQHSLRGLLPIILVVTALIAGLIFWAMYLRKSPKYRRKGVLMDTPPEQARSSRRRRRRQHRARNPSRAEVGGLPPPGAGGSDPTPL